MPSVGARTTASIVVFDCESDGLPTRVGVRNELNFDGIVCTVACALVVPARRVDGVWVLERDKETQHTYWIDVAPQFTGLLQLFDDADLIVGFNSLSFDLPLLYKHYKRQHDQYISHRLKSHDVFLRIRDATGTWPKLDFLLRENGLASKTSSGDEAVKMWEQQRRNELEAYCAADVRLTLELTTLPALTLNGRQIPAFIFSTVAALSAVMLSATP